MTSGARDPTMRCPFLWELKGWACGDWYDCFFGAEEYDRFVSVVESMIDSGSVEEIAPQREYVQHFGLQYARWFRCIATDVVWILKPFERSTGLHTLQYYQERWGR